MILSKSATYAIRSTLMLAEQRGGRPVRVDDIADKLGVPRNYLSKILHQLARTRVLESTRGPGGGFRLAVEPAELGLWEVVEHFDDIPGDDICLLGRAQCSAASPCDAHERWSEVRAVITGFLENTTMADLSRDDGPQDRLGPLPLASEAPDS